MPKEVLQSNWRYECVPLPDADGRYPNVGYQAYLDLDRLGYDQVPTASTWGFHGNIEQTVRLAMREKFSPDHLLGFMAAPWQLTTEDNLYTLMDDAYRLGRARRLFETG